ncbi:MAG: PIN domain-containing protein [Candidatus Hydrothermarchaeaceae archaeon]
MLLVVDANELFAAIIARGKTLNLFFDERLELISPEFILDEFWKHKLEIEQKSGLNEDDLFSFLLLLMPKIRFLRAIKYKEFLAEAGEISPDPNDVEYFALALKFNCSVWSEDKGLKRQSRIKVLPTKELVEVLSEKEE